MIRRFLRNILQERVLQVPVVALVGSRQVGKTTLARGLILDKPVHYLDLERPSDVAKLADPELYLGKMGGQLVILDEIQRVPELFPVLRGLVDERRMTGEGGGQFLILGSASPELLQQSSETLAGRISYLELTPLQLRELADEAVESGQHWFRGGYPESFLSRTDATAMQWCGDFISSYVERYLPQMGVALAPIQLRRFCSMLAHHQGSILNLSQLGNSLGMDGKTVRHYLDLLEGLFLVRRLPAWSRNVGKRLIKAPKVYWRDTGLLHQLLGLGNLEQVLGHPICGLSWEGYCVEQILNGLSAGTDASFYRTHAGAELDLVLESAQGEVTAIEIKRTLSPRLTAGFRESMESIRADRGFYIIPEGEAFPLSAKVEAMNLRDFLMRQLAGTGV